MLASSQCFIDFSCPFFKSGLCERPHCQFKHDVQKRADDVDKLSEESSKGIPTYTPTPLHKLPKKSDDSEKSLSKPTGKSSKPKESRVPEYTPTPISELKKKREDAKRKHSSDVEVIEEKPKKLKTKPRDEEVTVTKVKKDVKVLKDAPKVSKNVDEPKKESIVKTKVEESSVTSVESTQSTDSSSKKQRVAHQPMPASAMPRKSKLSASEVMLSRYKEMGKVSSSTTSSDDALTKKHRVAHAINLETIQNVEAKRPTMPIQSTSSKVPLAVRKPFLDVFINELLKFLPEQEAYDRGLTEEKQVYDKSPNKKLYSSIAANAVKRIRNEAGTSKSVSATKVGANKVVSHESILNGSKASQFSIEKRAKTLKAADLSESMLYTFLKKFTMKVETLKEYGYPMVDTEHDGCAILPPPDNKTLNDFKTSRRICCRCKNSFQVDDDGVPLTDEGCLYHWGRLWNERSHGQLDRKYSCCKMDQTAAGCSSADAHVVDSRGHPDFCKDYVVTKPRKLAPDACPGIFALDCEMVSGLSYVRLLSFKILCAV